MNLSFATQEVYQKAESLHLNVKIELMKLIALLVFIVGICAAIYLFIVHIKKFDWGAFRISATIGIVLVVLLGILIAKTANPRDTWCDNFRTTTSFPPMEVRTAMDWFEKGNFDYDTGNCKGAVEDYTKSINLNGKYPEAFNNKAYTEMRMGNYKDALTDLNSALSLNPNYVNALMNRGDIRNYYYQIDKNAAIADYQKIISLVGTQGTGVCGHLAMARHTPLNLLSFFVVPFKVMNCRGGI